MSSILTARRSRIGLLLAALLVVAGLSWSTRASAATPPSPTYGTAVVDGSAGEWSTSGDFFAKMYRAFDPSKPWESSLYLRYSCTEQRLYALVLVEPGYVVDPTPADAWVKVTGQPGNLITGGTGSFAWVTSGATTLGWEGSAILAPGSYNITAHVEVLDGGRQTSGTTGVSARTDIPLVIECGTVVVPEAPAVAMVKSVNGVDANAAPGPMVLVGSPVAWTYVVTNTGNVALSSVAVTDDRGVVVSCPSTALAVGASMTCTGNGTATEGQYTNIGTVRAVSPEGTPVTASDPANYFGARPSVKIVKSVNGDDANAAPGPMILVGGVANFTYVVTNDGNVALTGVSVTDDKGVVVTCPAATLAVGASMTCTGSSAAVEGQYTNTGTVTASGPVGAPVTASDRANYFGARPSVKIVKSVNGDDANAAPGAMILVGGTANFTYRVTNDGNVALTGVSVTDDKGVVVTCPADTLAAGASMTCTGSSIAVEGQYTNIGTVTATAPVGGPVAASDQANYFGARPSVKIVKSVNGDDANAAPGPMILVGGTANFTYRVTNDGNVALTGISVTDNKGVAVSCPATTLAAGASMTCTGSAAVVAGAYTNIGTVTATAPVGPAVTANDPANYFGADPRVAIVKSVNGNDANVAPGAYLPVGSTANFTYVVRNAGNVPLTGVVVTDDRGVVVTCPATTLAVGASMTCTGSQAVVLGQYTNTGTVTAAGPLGSSVTASDRANYFGVQLGKTMGFWGNTNGIARITAAGGYVANAVNLGGGARLAVIDTQAEAAKVLPNSLNACGKGTPAIFGTATADCAVAKGININSLNTLAGQTLALSYNIKLVANYNGQTVTQLGGAGALTGLTGLTANSTVADVLALANSLIANSGATGVTTQGQIGAMNTLLGILNRES